MPSPEPISLAVLQRHSGKLSDDEARSLFKWLCKGTRQTTRERLHEVIFGVPLYLWEPHILMDRVLLLGERITFAGQPADVTVLRQAIMAN